MNSHKQELVEANQYNLLKSNHHHHQHKGVNKHSSHPSSHPHCSLKVQKYYQPECEQKVVTVCRPIKQEREKVVEKVKIVEKRVPV